MYPGSCTRLIQASTLLVASRPWEQGYSHVIAYSSQCRPDWGAVGFTRNTGSFPSQSEGASDPVEPLSPVTSTLTYHRTSSSSPYTLACILSPSRGQRVAQLPLSRLQILPREVSSRIKPVSPLFRDPQQVQHQTGVPPGQNTPRYDHLGNGSMSPMIQLSSSCTAVCQELTKKPYGGGCPDHVYKIW